MTRPANGRYIPTALLHRRMLGLISTGATDRQIAAKIGVTYQAVSQVRRAEKVHRITGVDMRNTTCYLRVAEAPQDEWVRLAVAAAREGWSSEQIRECARAMNQDPCGALVDRLLAQPAYRRSRGKAQGLESALADLRDAAERVRQSDPPATITPEIAEAFDDAVAALHVAALPSWSLERLFR